MPPNNVFVSNLDETTRSQAIDMLNSALTDALALTMAIKQAHWTIKGPSFIGLHELLDEVAARFRDHSDMIAERAVILGGQTHGTIEHATQKTDMEPYPGDITWQGKHVDALTSRLMAFGGKLRQFIEACDEAGDIDTSDLFTEISRAVDKDAWFIGAHAEDKPA